LRKQIAEAQLSSSELTSLCAEPGGAVYARRLEDDSTGVILMHHLQRNTLSLALRQLEEQIFKAK